MDIYVFDSDYKKLGILQSPLSVSYIEKFKAKGEFSVSIALSNFNSKLIRKDNYLLFDKAAGVAGVIDKWLKDTNENEAPKITITGGLCDTFLYRRIIWGQYIKSGSSVDIVEDLVRTQVVAPSDPKRAIADIEIVSTLESRGNSIQYQNTGGVVGEAVADICSSDGFGFAMRFDAKAKKMTFQVVKGTDRTKGQKEVAPCIFSQQYENILSSNYEENYSTYKNVALVAGEGEGQQRKYATAGDNEVSGKQRCEVFVDARDLQSTDGDVAIPAEEYEAMLDQRGKEQLDTLRPVVNFDCTVNTEGNVKYGVDFFLGDKVTIEDSDFGELDAEISEVEVAYDSSGKSLYITFGYNQLSLAKAIKAKVVS